MKAALARTAMTLAVNCLGNSRREWALAMQSEFEAAREDGKPLAFASGCLLAACRELPAHEEGRFAIASHLLAFVLAIPIAALLVSSLIGGFPLSFLAHTDALWPAMVAERTPLLNDANLAAVPPRAALIAVLAAVHLRSAWLVLERDWTRVAAPAALAAAATTTLAIFTSVAFVQPGAALAQARILAAELIAVSALARWHERSFRGSPDAFT